MGHVLWPWSVFPVEPVVFEAFTGLRPQQVFPRPTATRRSRLQASRSQASGSTAIGGFRPSQRNAANLRRRLTSKFFANELKARRPRRCPVEGRRRSPFSAGRSGGGPTNQIRRVTDGHARREDLVGDLAYLPDPDDGHLTCPTTAVRCTTVLSERRWSLRPTRRTRTWFSHLGAQPARVCA